MSSVLSTSVFGNVDDCRTEVEISTPSGDLVAILYEDLEGWHIERLSDLSVEIPKDFIEEAKTCLRRYVNRTGTNAPLGLTRSGIALWLMTRDGGTAMGLPVA